MPFPDSNACADVSVIDGEAIVHPKRKKVAIIGFATNTLHLVPWQDPAFELWGLNQGYMNLHRRPERWFEMHTPEYTADVRDPQYLPWLTQCPVPLYMIEHYDEYPNSIRFPIEDAIRYAGDKRLGTGAGDYFTSSIAFMLALAGMEGFEEVHVYGVNLAIGDEYFYEKACAEWWIGYLQGKGIKVVIPNASSLVKQQMRYGYNPMRTTNAMTKVLLDGRMSEYQKQQQAKLNEYHILEGARREAEALRQIAEGLDRGADIVLMGDLSPKTTTS